MPHLFRLTLGMQFCDNLVSQVSGEAHLYSDGHWETASSWFLEYESLSDTQVIKKLKQKKETNKEKAVERSITGATEKNSVETLHRQLSCVPESVHKISWNHYRLSHDISSHHSFIITVAGPVDFDIQKA